MDQTQPPQPLSDDAPGHVGHPEIAKVEQERSISIHNSTPVAGSQGYQPEIPSSGSFVEQDQAGLKENIAADKDLEAALQEAVRAEAESHDVHAEGEKLEIENSYAPDTDQLAPESIPSPRKRSNRSPSYSPVLERVVPSISDVGYEPPGAEPSAIVSAQSSPFSPAPAEQITEDAEDGEDLVIFPGASSSLFTDENETVDSSLPKMNGSDPRPIEV
jgi:hypothetical protein